MSINQKELKPGSHFSKQPDPNLQDTPAQHKAKQTAALSASLPTSWALTPASSGSLSCQEPFLHSTYAGMGSSTSEKGGASIQARKSNLTLLSWLFGFLSPSWSPKEKHFGLLHRGRKEAWWGGKGVDWGERGGLGNPPQRPFK